VNGNDVPRQEKMEITEKWLGEIGGWAAMKAARGLADAGLAALKSADGEFIRGLAGGGKTKFACGLRIRSRTDVDNLCTCPSARRGMICEHSLAVALLGIRQAQEAAKPESKARISNSRAEPALKEAALSVPGRYSVFLPDHLLAGGLRDGLAAYVKYEPDGEGETSRLAAWLDAQGVKGRSAPLSLRGEILDQFLHALAGHPRVLCGKPSGGGIPIYLADAPVRLPLRATAEGENVLFKIPAETGRPLLGACPERWWVCQQTSTLFALPASEGEVANLIRETAMGTARRPLLWLVARRVELDSVFQLELTGGVLENFHVAPVPCQHELALEGSLQVLEARLSAEFQGMRWRLESNSSNCKYDNLFPIQDKSSPCVFYVDDEINKQRLFTRLRALGFSPMSGMDGEFWRLTGGEKILAFHASELPRLHQEVKVLEGERWRTVTRGLARISPVIKPLEAPSDTPPGGSGRDWLAMEFAYTAPDGFNLSRSEVLRLVRSGQRSVLGAAGKRYVLDLRGVEELEETLKDVPVQITQDGALIHAFHAPYLTGDILAERIGLIPENTITEQIGDLAAKLRPYQMLGVRWMFSLVLKGAGGVLGDEMGLGKTVQSIAAIRALKHSSGDADLPVLIVCPKSLTGNWRDEFKRFAPELKVAVCQGEKREDVLNSTSAYDVIITTYQLIVRDLKYHFTRKWWFVLLDEASHIRNPDTEAAKALGKLESGARLALTGTPVENSVRDLWSIYHFALPGYLGSRENFKERFEVPLVGGLDTPAAQAASERLKKLVRPYFIRRTKREVLRDLPEKIEQILWCDPTPAQAEVYRRLLEEGRDEIKAARKRSGQSGAKMTMFTVLLRLRQVCCDLRLTGLGGETLAGLSNEEISGKWGVLGERLDEIIEGGGKVLIFSQFVQYLRLVRAELEGQNLALCYLDGSSQDREAQVKTFQTDPRKRIFLISLKAGGYGLNLTAADHVILLDPWWNPAVEAQAIDRAHRIGQERVVTATRLAMRGTVEERILALQARKRGLVEAALDDESPLMSGLHTADLEGLLE